MCIRDRIFGDQIKLNFSTKQLTKNKPTKIPETTQNEGKDLEPKNNLTTKKSYEETYDDSSKNLANFFNGEIIDFDE